MPEETASTQPIRRPWALTLFGLLAIGGLIAMPLLVGEPDSTKMPDMVRFIGRFHPVLLHLPIGVFTLILLQELGAIFLRRNGRKDTGVFPIIFGAATAILAVIAGFLLYQGDGYEGNDLAERHLWGGLAFAVSAVLVMIVKAWTFASAGNPAFYRLLLFGSVGVMGFASHDGASITHGPDYLTKYAPDPILKLLGLPVREKPKGEKGGEGNQAPQDPVVYQDIIAPIFERRCNQCHKEGKTKGKLRMDTFEMLVKGGSEGTAIEPGNAEKSNIVVRMHLPLDEEEHMPPDGKPEPEAHEVVLIKWWLDSGADPAKKLSAMEVPEPVKAALAKLPAAPSAEAKAEAEKKAAGPAENVKAQVAELAKEFPGTVTFESQESSFVTINMQSLRGRLDDSMFKKFAPVFPQLVFADLGATNITDKGVVNLAAAPNLRNIRLQETQITDAAIDTLLKLPNLESINLYGTKVTNAGVMKLAALTKLKTIFLWQTDVSKETIAELEKKLPGAQIIKGVDPEVIIPAPAPAAPTAAPAPKPAPAPATPAPATPPAAAKPVPAAPAPATPAPATPAPATPAPATPAPATPAPATPAPATPAPEAAPAAPAPKPAGQ